MLGELVALGSALALAASAVISRSLAVLISPRPLQTMRALSGTIFLLILLPLFGNVGQVFQVSLPLIAGAAGSAVMGVALGDTFYMKTLSMVEVSRSFPTVRGVQLVSTMIVASMLFNEQVTWATAVGAAMIMAGVYLAAFVKKRTTPNQSSKSVPVTKWLFLAVTAGLCWTASSSFMKVVLSQVDALVAQTIKMPIAFLVLTMMSLQAGEGKHLRIRNYKRRTLLLIVLCGVLSYGIGVLLELYAISFAGLAKAVILTSWTPLFILFLSALFLKERITPRLITGIVLCSGGTILLMVL